VLARLGAVAGQLAGPAQAEQRIVVGRVALDHGTELLARFGVAAGAEVRPAEGFADRALVRLQAAGPLQRDGGGVEVAGLEQLRPAGEQLVDLVWVALVVHEPVSTV
jgi:hypothetical protein